MQDKDLLNNEKQLIEKYASNYITSDDSSQQRLMRDLEMRIVEPYLKRGHALELGCEIGYMSERIAKLVDHLDILDGSEEFINTTKKRNIPNANFYCGLFEDFKPETSYDCVFASHVLEHLMDVSSVLTMVKDALKPTGIFFVAVPNANALSRQLAKHMGIVGSLYDLTPNDLRGGHRRVYDLVSLTRELKNAGFEIIVQGGILFKPFADFQMDKLIDSGILGKEQCEGLYSLGFEYPNMCADIYAIARLKQ